MSRVDAYFAGLIDGEGSIGVYAVRTNGRGRSGLWWSAKLCVAGAHKPMIDACQTHFGVGSVRPQKRQSSVVRGTTYIAGENCKHIFRWTVSNKKDIAMIIARVLPFLIEKKEQSELMLKFCNHEIDGQAASVALKAAKRI